MNPIEIELTAQFDIAEFTSNGSVVAFNATQDKRVLFVVAKKKLDYRTTGPGASFVKVKTTEGQNYEVYASVDDNIAMLAAVENEPYNIHDVQLLGEDKILLVCARSSFRSRDDFDKNGRIYSTTGEYLTEILLGDGIQTTQTTSHGVIWTSYFDEGVFGNFGWAEPIGASGLVAWRADGSQAYQFQPIDDLNSIDDCYALNVENRDAVWCYYYSDFPLVKINSDVIEDCWQIPVKGSGVFAIEHDLALFRGGYQERDVWQLIRLKENHIAEVEQQFRFVFEAEVERIAARGDTVFMLAETKIYAISVSDCLSRL